MFICIVLFRELVGLKQKKKNHTTENIKLISQEPTYETFHIYKN